MPLPLILGIGAAVVGVGSGIRGAVKMKEANDTMQIAQSMQEEAIEKVETLNNVTLRSMDALGELELEIMYSFEKFSDIMEQIQKRPEFKKINIEGVSLPEFDLQELKKISVASGALLGGLSGAAAGTAGGFAASGAITSAVIAFGTASTGTALSSLSGAALVNATLATLGGGTLAAGGGGMALGSTILGGVSLGAGILVGGIIFSVAGNKLSDKADEAYHQARNAEEKADRISDYLVELKNIADKYRRTLERVNEKYIEHLNQLDYIVNSLKKTNCEYFTYDQNLVMKNTILLVQLLYKMCEVQLVFKSDDEDELNTINKNEAKKVTREVGQILEEKFGVWTA